MAFPVGAYVAAHLAAQRMRNQNNKSTYSSDYSYSKPCNPTFFHKKSGKIIEYEYHNIYVKELGSYSIGHNDNIKKIRKEIRYDFFKNVLSIYIVLGLMSTGVIFSILFF